MASRGMFFRGFWPPGYPSCQLQVKYLTRVSSEQSSFHPCPFTVFSLLWNNLGYFLVYSFSFISRCVYIYIVPTLLSEWNIACYIKYTFLHLAFFITLYLRLLQVFLNIPCFFKLLSRYAILNSTKILEEIFCHFMDRVIHMLFC